MITSPYFCIDDIRRKDKLVRIFINTLDDCSLIYTLPRWLEQTYLHTQIIILDTHNKYHQVFEICNRHQKKIDIVDPCEIPNKTTDCLYLSTDLEIKNVGLNDDVVVILTDSKTLPSPYFVDIALLNIKKTMVKNWNYCLVGSAFAFKLKDNIENKESTIITQIQKQESVKKCTVYIPCMNREEHIVETLPMWINQKYNNTRIVVIDYSSAGGLEDIVTKIAHDHKRSFCVYDETKNNDADIILIKIPGMKYFNISHAYNYAIKRISTDIICTVCGDSCPRDYYLDMVCSLVDKNTLVQCWWGLHTITYDNWKRLNGHQEFIVGWGAEDDDFRYRAKLLGLTVAKIPDYFIFQIPQKIQEKGRYRQIVDSSVSADINSNRFHNYIAQHGPVANYGKDIGGDQPIELCDNIEHSHRISVCEYEKVQNNPPVTKISDNVYYTLINEDNREWAHFYTWEQYGKIKRCETYPLLSTEDTEIQLQLQRFLKNN